MQFIEWIDNVLSISSFSCFSQKKINANNADNNNDDNCNCNFLKIEDDLLKRLYAACSSETLFRLIQCNRKLLELIQNDDYIWSILCKLKCYHPLPSSLPVPIITPPIVSTDSFTIGKGVEIKGMEKGKNFVFKSIYKDNLITKRNWFKGQYRSWLSIHIEEAVNNSNNNSSSSSNSRPLQRITPKVYLYFDKTRAISINIIKNDNEEGSIHSGNDQTRNSSTFNNHIWDMQTGHNIGTLPDHICCVKMDEKGIVTGNADGIVKIWDNQSNKSPSSPSSMHSSGNGECQKILYGHQGEINCLQITNEHIVTGSEDWTMRIWNRSNGECLHVLKSNEGPICCLSLMNDLIYSGSVNGFLGIWSMKEGTLISKINLKSGMINCIQSMNNLVVTGCKNGLVHILNESGVMLKSIQAHYGPVVCLQFSYNDILVTGSTDSLLIVWNLKSGEKLYEINDHRGTVWNLHLDETRLISSGFDNRLIARYFGPK